MINFLALSVSILTLLAGTRALQVDPGTQQVRVVLRIEKGTLQQSIEVWDKSASPDPLCRACEASLSSAGFEKLPVSFNVNVDGVGNVRVGPREYRIHEDPSRSGGISCGRIYSNREALVSCDINIPNHLQLSRMRLKKRNLAQCFQRGSFGLNPIYNHYTANENLNRTQPESQAQAMLQTRAESHTRANNKIFFKEKKICDPYRTPGVKHWLRCPFRSLAATCRFTEAVKGDGMPHQNSKNIQLSVSPQAPLMQGDPGLTELLVGRWEYSKASSVGEVDAQSQISAPNRVPLAGLHTFGP
ncbi:hypothetical protein HIM_08786 [Hirsutella minnesotensis 3608]|uniref:Cyanovirin-N domain-containing protein n=1 Tax=Hirsutella minnesotensis 3608 TaxID=1043627 RepID=A0A0F7ZM89_9HYPO|nr:hypothetical protein HIM_08786 [Hirsutella minnesotensis 3608]